MGFFVTGKRGTMRGPPRCNATDACMKLYNGMKGLGTDEAAITSVVGSHNSKQRQQIRKKYSQVYKKDLIKELDGELSFAFGKLVAALMMDPEDYTLECIHRAVVQQSRGGKIVKRLSAMFKEGLSKTEYSILSLLCPRTNKQLEQINAAFSAKYELDLDERIALGGNDLPQDLCTLLLDMLSGERQEDEEVDLEQVEEDTDNLIGESGGEDVFQEMMQERSFSHLKAMFEQYAEVTGRSIEDFVDESEQFSVELKEAYKGIILILTNEPEFYAARLRTAIEGAGTDDETLIRIVVLRSEVDLVDIVESYERKFGITLADDVIGDTSGDYQELLLKIIAVPPEAEKEEKKIRKPTRKPVVKKVVKKVEEDEVLEEEEEQVVVVRKTRKPTRKTVVRKVVEVEEDEEEEEQEPVVLVEKKPVVDMKQVRKLAKPRKAVAKVDPLPPPPPPKEEEPEEEIEDEKVEEEEGENEVEVEEAAIATVSKASEVNAEPPEEDEVAAEVEPPSVEVAEDAAEEDVPEMAEVKDEESNPEEVIPPEIEDEQKESEESGEVKVGGEEEDTEAETVVVIEPEQEEDTIPTTTGNATSKSGSEKEEAVSPVISREL